MSLIYLVNEIQSIRFANICVFCRHNALDIMKYSRSFKCSFHFVSSPLKYTLLRRYNAVNFYPNSLKMHPIARRLGEGMGRNLWFDTVIYIMLQSTQCYIQCLVIFDRVITALDCMHAVCRSELWCFRNKISVDLFGLLAHKLTLCLTGMEK